MIKSVSIRNFRSIKELDLDVGNLVALIGPNSSGKTNILKALDLILGERWAVSSVSKELFNNSEQPITIEVVFNDQISFINSKGYKTSISSIKLEINWNPEPSATTTINDGKTFYDQKEFKKLCHFIYIPSERNLSSELRVSQWTMLGKMMRLIYENYVLQYRTNIQSSNLHEEAEEKLKNDFRDKMKPAKDFLENDFSTTEVTFKKFVDIFKEKCRHNSAGLANEFEPVLDIYNLNWFYKTLQIHVKEDTLGKNFDSDDVGAGMQNLLMISIFQTYSELMGGKVIFGIEEPEIYLYPQAQRSLYKSFIKLSEKSQILYTTHNPNFVDSMRADDINLLRKSSTGGTYKLKKDEFFNTNNANKEKFKYKIYTHFNPERNELFFAKKVLFVEGDSDKILFETLCEERWKIDLDILGISIISCSGKSGVNYFLGVCNIIGVDDYFAVWDEDPDDENYEPEERDLLPNAIKNGHGLEIKENLEKFLKLPSGNSSNKVKNAHKWATNNENKIPEEFEIVKKFLTE